MHIFIYIYHIFIYRYHIFIYIYIFVCTRFPPKKNDLIPTNEKNPSHCNSSTPWGSRLASTRFGGASDHHWQFLGWIQWWFGTREVKVLVSTVIYPLLKTYGFENWWLEDVPFELVRWHSFIFVGVPLDYRALGLWSLWLEFLFWNVRVPPKKKHGVQIGCWQRVMSEGEGFICFIYPRSVALAKKPPGGSTTRWWLVTLSW